MASNRPSPICKEFPPSILPLTDLSLATWVKDRIRPVGRSSDRVLLWSVIPEGFPSYARILHPAYVAGEDTPLRWGEVAARNNKTVHPSMQFGRLSGSDDPYAYPSWVEPPFVGELPEAEAKTLAATLRNFTATPEQCYLLVWEGYGGIEQMYPSTERLELPGRGYLAYTGSIDSVLELCVDGNTLMGPNLWWPEDQAWLVATEIDFMETYIGGSTECIDQLLGDPDLESFPVPIDGRVDFLADDINT